MEVKVFSEHKTMFDQYAASHPRGDVLQTTAWGELKSLTGWNHIPLGVLADGQLRAAALILWRRLPIPGHTIFYSPRGPLFSDTDALQVLLNAGKQIARQYHALLWKMDPALPVGDPQWETVAEQLRKVESGPNFESIQPKFIMELDIRPPLEEILGNMKNKTRYNIRYAFRKKVKIVRSQERDDIKIFYPLLQETAERDGFTVRSIEYFYHIWDCLIKRNLAALFLSYHDGEALGGTIAFKLGRRAWYVYGASSNRKRNLQPNYAIQWEMIKWAKSSGCTVYDFRGVSGDLDPENPLYGLYRFKEGFGAKLVEYVGEFDLPCSMLYPLWTLAAPLYRRFR